MMMFATDLSWAFGFGKSKQALSASAIASPHTINETSAVFLT